MNATWDVVDTVHLPVETCVMETGDGGRDWQSRLHIPLKVGKEVVIAQVNKFTDKWELLRPDVAGEWSDKYHRRGTMSDGVYA
eukprot:11029126-Prorocentrum_lima.AAC.2